MYVKKEEVDTPISKAISLPNGVGALRQSGFVFRKRLSVGGGPDCGGQTAAKRRKPSDPVARPSRTNILTENSRTDFVKTTWRSAASDSDEFDEEEKPREPQVSGKFWYSDGSVVVRADDWIFKLYKARLAQFSPVLAELFRGGPDPLAPLEDGLPVYVLRTVSAREFSRFLAALELPNNLSKADYPTTVTVLRAAHRLACTEIESAAARKLTRVWPSSVSHVTPPRAGDPSLADAREMVELARECGLRGILRRAFYDTLRSRKLWDALADDELELDAREEHLLLRARMELTDRFHAVVRECPPPHTALLVCPGLPKFGALAMAREDAWRAGIANVKEYEDGRTDPVGALGSLIAMLDKPVFEMWCADCRKERRSAWMAAREEWWGWLEDLLVDQA